VCDLILVEDRRPRLDLASHERLASLIVSVDQVVFIMTVEQRQTRIHKRLLSDPNQQIALRRAKVEWSVVQGIIEKLLQIVERGLQRRIKPPAGACPLAAADPASPADQCQKCQDQHSHGAASPGKQQFPACDRIRLPESCRVPFLSIQCRDDAKHESRHGMFVNGRNSEHQESEQDKQISDIHS
jgi:hypothetical protein